MLNQKENPFSPTPCLVREVDRDIVFCDIDHVLSNAAWRANFIESDGWDAYHKASIDDDPISDMVALVNALWVVDITVIGLSARPEKWHMLTSAWLSRHSVKLGQLLMRPESDFRSSALVKVDLVKEYFLQNEELMRQKTLMVLDDKEPVIEAFKALGITALQVHARIK